jgi:hypothetical protein
MIDVYARQELTAGESACACKRVFFIETSLLQHINRSPLFDAAVNSPRNPLRASSLRENGAQPQRHHIHVNAQLEHELALHDAAKLFWTPLLSCFVLFPAIIMRGYDAALIPSL